MGDDAAQKEDSIDLPASAPTDKFVRTFATDAEALHAGQVPDFMKKAADPAVVPAAAPETEAPSRSDILSRLQAAAGEAPITPLSPPKPPPLPTVPPPSPGETVIHTYKADFAEEAKGQEASRFSIVAAEQDAAPQPAPAPSPAKTANRSLAVISIALVALGLAAALGAYWYISRPTTVAVATLSPTRIFVDARQTLSGSGNTLIAEIAKAVAAPLADNSIELLSTSDSQATTSVFSALELPAPGILLRNINADGSMAGVVDANGVQSPFFLLSVASYGDTFAGMLAWEPSLPHDLAPLYPPSASTSTAAIVFHDQVVLNHDVRVLKDANGKTLLLYGYFDPATLIIARDEGAFAEILDRLTNSHTQQ